MVDANQIEGVGIGLRREFASALLESDRTVDWLEVIPENIMGKAGRFPKLFERCRSRWPVAAHGVALNLGGPDPFDPDHLSQLKNLLSDFEIDSFSEHACYSSAGGHFSYDLLPLPMNEEAVKHVAKRVVQIQDQLERRILIENISTYAVMPGSDLDEGTYHTAICEEADCGLLLDVNNIYVNAFNHGIDPSSLLRSMPLSRVGQMHIAGHMDKETFLLDDHGHPVSDGVWELYREALTKCGKVPVLLEWDTHIPSLERVLDEADHAREIYQAVTHNNAGQ
jgi:uncharacterized protein